LRLPPLAGAPVAELLEVAAAATKTVSPRLLASDRVQARFDAIGALTALCIDGRDQPFTAQANTFVICPDHPHFYEARDIDRQALALGKVDHRKADVAINADAGDVAFTRPLGKNSRVTVRYRLDPGSPVLRVAYNIDWQEPHTLLKTIFPTSYLGHDARFGTPFGSVRRPQLPGSQTDEARWEVPASRWAVVTDDAESAGFAVITEAKFGFSSRDGLLGLSLVRSAKITGEERGAIRSAHPESIRRTTAPHVCSDIGQQHIEIALGRFDPHAPREEQPAALAELLFTPPVSYRGPACASGYLGLKGGESLQPVWAKPLAPGQWVLRLHETLGRSGSAQLQLSPGWTAQRVNLCGQTFLPPIKGQRIDFKAYQIVSLHLSQSATSQ